MRARQARRDAARRTVLLDCDSVVAAGRGSNKPGYCSAHTNLETSINGLTSLGASSGISGRRSQLQKSERSATALVNAATSDFPSQANAITTSVDALTTAAKASPSCLSPGQIATIARNASSVVNTSQAHHGRCELEVRFSQARRRANI